MSFLSSNQFETFKVQIGLNSKLWLYFSRLENRTLFTLGLDELACLPQVEPAALVIDSVAGANVSLRCSVFGLPSASVSWWHSNRLVANGSELQHAWEDQYYTIAEYRTNEHQVQILNLKLVSKYPSFGGLLRDTYFLAKQVVLAS